MIKFLINRPIAVIMTFIALLVLGFVAYRYVPVSLMPDIPIPEITVNINFPDHSARELENAVVKPLRTNLMQVSHLDQIKSETRNGLAIIKLRFNYGSKIDYSYIEVNEKVDASMNYLPRDMERPKVIKASATDIPVFYLNLSLKNTNSSKPDSSINVTEKFVELSSFAENVIRKRIEQLPEVAMVDISGLVKPQISIEPDLEKLNSLNISIAQIENAISENNINPGSLTIKDGHYQYNIQFNSVLRECADIENIYLNVAGKIMQLKDIAKVYMDIQKRNGMYVSNGKPAIVMAVTKQADAKLSEMKDKIKDLSNQLEKDYPEIQFEVSQDQTQLLDYSISNLKQNLGLGLLLVIIVVFLFLKDFKSPFLIGLSLLISMIICMLFFRLMGLSVNIISLAGLILAVGNMIDNSIVITDNISQYRERGLNIDDACITGTNEVMIPMLSSLLTNVAVFVPMIFLSGIAGALIYDEAMSVVIGLSVSYLVGITLLPVIFKLIYNINRKPKWWFDKLKELKFFRQISGFIPKLNFALIYEKGLDFTFRYKKLNLIIYLMAIPLGFAIVYLIKKEKMPQLPQLETIVKIEWNENIYPDENRDRILSILSLIDANCVQSNSFIGQQQFLMNLEHQMSASESKIYIKSNKVDHIGIINQKITEWIRDNYPKAEIFFEAPTSIFEKLFTSSEAPFVAEISLINKNSDWNIGHLMKMQNKIESVLKQKTASEIPLQDNVVLSVDREKLLMYGVDFQDLLREMKTAFNENYVGTLKSFQQYLPIVFTGKDQLLNEILNKLNVYNSKKELIPVKYLISKHLIRDLKTIVAGREGEYVPLAFYPTTSNKNLDEEKLSTMVKQSGLFEVNFSGSIFTSALLLKEMGVILIISVMLLYFILAAQFESLVQPFLVLVEIPIDFSAAMLFLYIAGQSLNLMSAIGMIVMSGIIINDSILKIDVINQLRKEGMGLSEAIKEGGHRRLRAILMTSLTSILAMFPLLFGSDMGSELQKPFSFALIGGMLVGTIVSLYFVPLVYWWIYRKTEEKYRGLKA